MKTIWAFCLAMVCGVLMLWCTSCKVQSATITKGDFSAKIRTYRLFMDDQTTVDVNVPTMGNMKYNATIAVDPQVNAFLQGMAAAGKLK